MIYRWCINDMTHTLGPDCAFSREIKSFWTHTIDLSESHDSHDCFLWFTRLAFLTHMIHFWNVWLTWSVFVPKMPVALHGCGKTLTAARPGDPITAKFRQSQVDTVTWLIWSDCNWIRWFETISWCSPWRDSPMMLLAKKHVQCHSLAHVFWNGCMYQRYIAHTASITVLIFPVPISAP